MRRVAILGAGGMGTALAVLLSKSVADVRLWSRDPEHAQQLGRTRINARHLPGIALPASIAITCEGAAAAAGADLLVAAIPTSYLRATLEGLAPGIPPS